MPDRIAPLTQTRVVAVLRGPSAEGTVHAAEALIAGGITGIEVTFTTPDALEVITELARRHGNQILLGAGTVRTGAQAEAAAQAGAQFLVSPGATPELAAAMTSTGLVTLMGALTPSEVLQVIEWGADVVKLFPASLGGPALLKSLRGPFPDVRFCPTGGVHAGNLEQWFAAGAIAVGAGSELCSAADIAEANWARITSTARTFAQAVAL